MKSGPLSNADVIKKINEKFIPLEINITDEGFPAEIPALKLWEKAYKSKASFKVGFATTVIVEPKGRYPLGTSGSGYLGEYDKAINYHADKYLKFLDESLERASRARELETSTTLTPQERASKHKKLIEDILRSIHEANQGASH
jgi:hypothetical protein